MVGHACTAHHQMRFEEVFVPDNFTPTAENPYTYLDISELNKRDEVLSRRELREVQRRRGEHDNQQEFWIEKEWEVRSHPRAQASLPIWQRTQH